MCKNRYGNYCVFFVKVCGEYNKTGVAKKAGYSYELNAKVDETPNKCIFPFDNGETL